MSNWNLRGPRFEISIEDSAYPSILKETKGAPERIYGIGNPEALKPSVAVIGARKVTPYGKTCTETFARQAARRGLSIISGGAIGCDQIAHQAALDEDAQTVVVFGSGANVIYPKSGKKLFEEVVANDGAVISEHPWDTKPMPYFFRERNRIIAGFALMLVIAEAGMPSGTFSTADAALSAGRDVAVVPGSILSPYSKGTNNLLLQGATPIIDVKSFNDALDSAFQRLPLTLLEQIEKGEENCRRARALKNDRILVALSADAYAPEELAAYFGFSPIEIMQRLSEYEIAGLVERHKDGRYFLI